MNDTDEAIYKRLVQYAMQLINDGVEPWHVINIISAGTLIHSPEVIYNHAKTLIQEGKDTVI